MEVCRLDVDARFRRAVEHVSGKRGVSADGVGEREEWRDSIRRLADRRGGVSVRLVHRPDGVEVTLEERQLAADEVSDARPGAVGMLTDGHRFVGGTSSGFVFASIRPGQGEARQSQRERVHVVSSAGLVDQRRGRINGLGEVALPGGHPCLEAERLALLEAIAGGGGDGEGLVDDLSGLADLAGDHARDRQVAEAEVCASAPPPSAARQTAATIHPGPERPADHAPPTSRSPHHARQAPSAEHRQGDVSRGGRPPSATHRQDSTHDRPIRRARAPGTLTRDNRRLRVGPDPSSSGEVHAWTGA